MMCESIGTVVMVGGMLCLAAQPGFGTSEGGLGVSTQSVAASVWPIEGLKWRDWPAMPATTGVHPQWASVGRSPTGQVVVRWPQGFSMHVTPGAVSILVTLSGRLELDGGASRNLGALSYAALAGGAVDMRCREGDCVFYWFPNGSILGGKQGQHPPDAGYRADASTQLVVRDLVSLPRRVLERKRAIEVSAVVGPLNLASAVVQKWPRGVRVTGGDLLLSGSGIVLAGEVALRLREQPAISLSSGSCLEVPPGTRFEAECRGEECLLLTSCHDRGCILDDQKP